VGRGGGLLFAICCLLFVVEEAGMWDVALCGFRIETVAQQLDGRIQDIAQIPRLNFRFLRESAT
jgi:hypothetical protein